jgi:hypothetical protein
VRRLCWFFSTLATDEDEGTPNHETDHACILPRTGPQTKPTRVAVRRIAQ